MIVHEGLHKRVVTEYGRENYELLMGSGLYSELARAGLLVPHTEEDPRAVSEPDCCLLLRPEQLDFISYPYEWSFSQLKDAALLTLEVQKRALRHGMSLKDASAFNVQFRMAEPLFIDTLSFERDSGGPWIGYEQFCRHFLGPLLLWSKWPKAGQYLRVDLDGLSLAAVSNLLGWRTYLRSGPLMHIHLHARAQRAYQNELRAAHRGFAGRNMKPPLVDSLWRAVERIEAPQHSAWSDYDRSADHYTAESAAFKQEFVRMVVRQSHPRLAYDIGGNTGVYARLIAAEGCQCVLYDSDPVCVDLAYRQEKAAGNGLVFPLLMDACNPSPAVGFDLAERDSFLDRPPADLALALALLHHMRLHHSIPFSRLAGFLSKLAPTLVAEYASPEDGQVQALISRRGSVPDDYSHHGFVSAFSRHFRLRREVRIPGMDRWLFWFER